MQDNIRSEKEKWGSARKCIPELEKGDVSSREGIPWFGMLFLVLLVLLDIGLTILFYRNDWNVVGHRQIGAAETGAIISLALAAMSVALLIRWRSANVTGAEIGLYWLGCSAAFLFAWFGYFSLGLTIKGFVIAGAFFIVISAVLMVLWRGARLSGAEAGLYWLGCTAASFYALAECAYILVSRWAPNIWAWRPYEYYIAYTIALIIAAITAVALIRWRKDTDRFWLVGTLLAMGIALGEMLVVVKDAIEYLALLPLIVLISALVLAFRERKGNKRSPVNNPSYLNG